MEPHANVWLMLLHCAQRERLEAHALPSCREHRARRRRCLQEIREVGSAGEGKVRCTTIASDRSELAHDVAHARFVCCDEEHREIVYPEMLVDRAGGDDLSVGKDLAANDRVDTLGAHVSFEREVAVAERKERVRLDPFWRAQGLGHQHTQRMLERARARRRGLDDVYVVDELRAFILACADLDIEDDIGGHVIMSESKDARRRVGMSADS